MKTFLFIIWMILTVVLTCTIVGLLIFIPTTYLNSPNDPSTWMKIGLKLSDIE